jgi:hypothetical protein
MIAFKFQNAGKRGDSLQNHSSYGLFCMTIGKNKDHKSYGSAIKGETTVMKRVVKNCLAMGHQQLQGTLYNLL